MFFNSLTSTLPMAGAADEAGPARLPSKCASAKPSAWESGASDNATALQKAAYVTGTPAISASTIGWFS